MIEGQNVEATFFVAQNGNDEWSGMLSDPSAAETDGPFATLARARDAGRQNCLREHLPPFRRDRGWQLTGLSATARSRYYTMMMPSEKYGRY